MAQAVKQTNEDGADTYTNEYSHKGSHEDLLSQAFIYGRILVRLTERLLEEGQKYRNND